MPNMPSCTRATPCPARRAPTLTEAAALPETLFTVWHNVLEPARRPEGRRDAAGAWRHLRHRHDGDPARHGARRNACCATAGSAAKCAACASSAPSRAINYREADFVAAVKASDRRAGRRRHPRHGRRRLYQRAIIEAAADRRPHRPDRLPERPQVAEVNFSRLMLKRLDAYRLDTASAHHRSRRPPSRPSWRRRSGRFWRTGACKPRDRRDLPARRGGGRSTAGWRAMPISARSCWSCRYIMPDRDSSEGRRRDPPAHHAAIRQPELEPEPSQARLARLSTTIFTKRSPLRRGPAGATRPIAWAFIARMQALAGRGHALLFEALLGAR